MVCPEAGVNAQKRAGRLSIFEQPFGSKGTIENSPASQCRARLEKPRVPQGRLKWRLPRRIASSKHCEDGSLGEDDFFQPSLRDLL
jgi:hypothetical protein